MASSRSRSTSRASCSSSAGGVELDDVDVRGARRPHRGLAGRSLPRRARALKAGATPLKARVLVERRRQRFIGDYLQSELLDHSRRESRGSYSRTCDARTSSAALCDAVLDATRIRGAAPRTTREPEPPRRPARPPSAVVPVPPPVPGTCSHAELQRREPDLVDRSHASAAAWCEANNEPETAIEHASGGRCGSRGASSSTVAQPVAC